MGTSGGRPDLGPFPDWVVRWLYPGDYRERQISLQNADLAPAWPVHLREGAAGKNFDRAGSVGALGRVVSISARPTTDFSQGYVQRGATANDRIVPVGPATCFSCGKWKWDSAHLPDAFFVPYMLTGDFFFLEESWFWTSFSAIYPVAATNVNYGRGASLDSGAIYMGQERSEAWGLRERAETAWISPDSSPEKALLYVWMDDFLAVLDGVYNVTTSPTPTLVIGYGDGQCGSQTRGDKRDLRVAAASSVVLQRPFYGVVSWWIWDRHYSMRAGMMLSRMRI